MNLRTITVQGTGHITARPDLTIITMKLENTALSYQNAMQLASDAIEAIRSSLLDLGYPKDSLKTTDFTVDSLYESYKDNTGNWKQKFTGYQCVHRLKLEFDFDMEQLNQTLSAIASSNTNPEFKIAFSVKDKNAVSEQLLQSAVKNAAEKAAVLAAAAGLTLGAIQTIDYRFGELPLHSDTEIGEPLCLASKAEPAINIEPEDIKARDTVTVVWAIE